MHEHSSYSKRIERKDGSVCVVRVDKDGASVCANGKESANFEN